LTTLSQTGKEKILDNQWQESLRNIRSTDLQIHSEYEDALVTERLPLHMENLSLCPLLLLTFAQLSPYPH